MVYSLIQLLCLIHLLKSVLITNTKTENINLMFIQLRMLQLQEVHMKHFVKNLLHWL